MANDYFTGDRLFWDDPDFDTVYKKVVYAMLWQCVTTDIAGIHPRHDQMDATRCGLSLTKYRETLDTLSIPYGEGKVRVWDTLIWVKSAIWRNLYKGKFSDQQLKAVNECLWRLQDGAILREIMDYYQRRYTLSILSGYPIDTLSIPYCTVSVSVSESESKETLSVSSETDRVISDLNKRTGQHYKSNTPKTQKLIRARLAEGMTVDDLLEINRKKVDEWQGSDMEKYLRPITLYGTKAESYLNQPERKGHGQRDSGGIEPPADKYNGIGDCS